jgi:hypothetical protein
MMTIGEAIAALKNGRRVRRDGWNGKGMWLRLVRGSRVLSNDIENFPHLDYIEMKTANDKLIPFCSQSEDLLATDWEIAE